jgi:hypothetical protein
VWFGASIGSGAPCETLLLSTRPNAGRSWRRKPELGEILVAAVSDGPPIGTGVALFLMVTFGGAYAVWVLGALALRQSRRDREDRTLKDALYRRDP